MLLQRHQSRVCRKKHKSRAQALRVFKTAPLYAVTNPEETAPQDIWTTFTTFFESLWSPSTNPDGSTVQKAGMSYVYDEDGTLIVQKLTDGAQGSWGQSARYVYLPTAAGPMPVAAIYGTKHYAIQSDHLNTPRRLIQSDGQVAWQWAYSAFGEEKPTTAKTRFADADLNQSFGTTTVPAVTFNLRYPGQYYDQESNLHYNYHRSYSATAGRYTQADPIGLDGGWNRFSYAEQNPLSFTDTFGLAPDGHHWVIGLIRNDPNLSSEAAKVFRDAKTGWYGERHGWDKPHAEYNKGVQDLWNSKNYNKPCMTKEQAEDFVKLVKQSSDPRISSFRNFIYGKITKWAFRGMPYSGKGGND